MASSLHAKGALVKNIHPGVWSLKLQKTDGTLLAQNILSDQEMPFVALF